MYTIEKLKTVSDNINSWEKSSIIMKILIKVQVSLIIIAYKKFSA